MSLRYTLRLTTNGAEVWKRWTGDRKEAGRLAANALVDMDVREQPGLMFMAILSPEFTLSSAMDSVESTAHSNDFRSTLTLEVRRTGKEESSERPDRG